MATSSTATATDTTKAAEVSHTAPIVLDLGKQRRKQIKQLRRGEGRLLDDINGAIEELRTVGTIGVASQPVVIIIREKRRKTKSLLGLV